MRTVNFFVVGILEFKGQDFAFLTNGSLENDLKKVCGGFFNVQI